MVSGLKGLLTSVRSLVAESGGGYDLTWNTYDGGGGTSTGGGFELSGTAGQPDAGEQVLTGGNYSLAGGFWPGVSCGLDIPADYDKDCDVDQGDYALFEACASGPEFPHGAGCDDRDFDTDGDVDGDDFAAFQRCLSGENVPGDPNCAS
jgi:hypothetical protein